jgi:uncharacterized protein
MVRLLVLIVLIVAALWLVRRALRAGQAKAPLREQQGQAGGELVRCAQCGLLLPRAEARQAAGAIYCSEEHAKLGAGRGPAGR